jgi:hypothetical protein
MKLREITGGGVNADKVRGKEPAPKLRKPGGNETPHPMRGRLVGEDQQLDEIAPAIYAAVMWILNYSARRAAWPVLRWVIKRHMGKIAIGATAAYYIDQGWDWVVSVIGEKYAQMLIDNKFEIGMAVALILGAVALQKFFMKKGDDLVAKYQENINENVSGAVASVAMPIGDMRRRGVAPKRKAKKKNR